MAFVLFAVERLGDGGPDKVMSLVASELHRSGWRVEVVVAVPGGRYYSDLGDLIPIHTLPRSRHRLSARYPILGLARSVRLHRPDVVLTTQHMNLAAGLGKAFWPARVSLVQRVSNHVSANERDLARRGSRYRLASAAIRFALRRADCLIAQGEEMATDLREIAPHVPVKVIGNPVAPASGGRPGAVAVMGTPALVAVGRLAQQKGFDLALRSLPVVRNALGRAHLTIVGDGQEREALDALAKSLGVDDFVSFVGHHPDPNQYLQQADVLVAPSRYEGRSNVILEALSLGIPVVASDGPGVSQGVVVNGVNGMVFRSESISALAEAIVAACGSIAWDREAIARDAALKWSLEAIGRQYEEVLGTWQ